MPKSRFLSLLPRNKLVDILNRIMKVLKGRKFCNIAFKVTLHRRCIRISVYLCAKSCEGINFVVQLVWELEEVLQSYI